MTLIAVDAAALDALRDAVKRGVDIAHHHAAAFPSESAYGHCTWHDSHKASSGDMNAALAFFEAKLPGWKWLSGWAVGNATETRATVWLEHEDDKQWRVHSSQHPSPAPALLLACLDALRAEVAG